MVSKGKTREAEKGETHTVAAAVVGGHPNVLTFERKPSAPDVT